MTDKDEVMNFIKKFNLSSQVYTDREFIEESAVKLGAVETICVRGELDFAFDAKGKCLGTYTTSASSWRRYKNINGYCPHCNFNLDGDLIVDTFISQGKTREKVIEDASYYEGWKVYGEENRWGRAIGLSDLKLDRVTRWECPDCHKTWERKF